MKHSAKFLRRWRLTTWPNCSQPIRHRKPPLRRLAVCFVLMLPVLWLVQPESIFLHLLRKSKPDNIVGAARTILSANILGASCARVCPTEVLCEGACVMVDRQRDPIKIGASPTVCYRLRLRPRTRCVEIPGQEIRETDRRNWCRTGRRRMRGRTSPTWPSRGDL